MDHTRELLVSIFMQEREDGGLRVWSDDVPGLVLSHSDPQKVIEDIPAALTTILGHTLDMTITVVGVQSQRDPSAATPRLKRMQVSTRAA